MLSPTLYSHVFGVLGAAGKFIVCCRHINHNLTISASFVY